MLLLWIMILLLPISQQTVTIEKIESLSGYAEIKIDEVEIMSKSDIILHIIHPQEILTVINNFEIIINSTDLEENKNVTLTQIKILKNKVKTIIPHTFRRGLINFGGKILNWLYGTMDDDGRQDIDNHLKTIDKNNHKAIQNINQQIKINDNFNRTLTFTKDIHN